MSEISFTGAAAASMSAPKLRLTPRGRTVFTALAATPLVAVALFFGLGGGDAAASQVSGTPLEYVSVAPGQSLWQLSQQIAPEADPREVIADIIALNQLGSADVQPGQELAVPVQYSG